jgi:tripartite-type tricarboxylate transporter receptor subunit TctC
LFQVAQRATPAAAIATCETSPQLPYHVQPIRSKEAPMFFADTQSRSTSMTAPGPWYLALPVLALTCVGAHAQYPTKPIRLIVANSPGGGSDASGRLLGVGLTQSLGKQVLIDNRAGAGGNIAMEIAAKATPDGYTLAMANAGHAVSVGLYKKLGFDLIKDFIPVSLVLTSPYGVTVNPSLGVKSINELVTLAKAKPNALNFGSSSNGTFLGGALLFDMAGVKLNNVSYKGGAPTLIALLGNEVSVALTSLSATLVHVRSGKLRVLAVSTPKRSPTAPDIPTVAESGIHGYEATSWFGMVTPIGVPKDIIARLNAETVKIAQSPDFKDKFIASGFDPAGSTAEEFGAYIRAEIERWGKVIKSSGIKVE